MGVSLCNGKNFVCDRNKRLNWIKKAELIQGLAAALEDSNVSAEALIQPTHSSAEAPIEPTEPVPLSPIAQADAPNAQPAESPEEPLPFEPSSDSQPSEPALEIESAEPSPSTSNRNWQFSVEPYFFAPFNVNADVTKAQAEGKMVPFSNHNSNFQVDLNTIPFGTKVASVMSLELFQN